MLGNITLWQNKSAIRPLENYFPCKRLKKRSFAYRLAVGCIIMLCQAKCLLVSYASSIYAKKQLSFTKFIDKLAN